ncbi:SDR family oxidoreductase [Pseudonocardia benzenivorans]|uniref:SDR family oxidoreductase n=1 Tax=Pseudonocardia benzenivorans TaxID=228005 RepID=A0ABW3VRZ2_9PSEU|nr:short-chain dehydrogenase [Pseudonocardia sp. D17]
MTTADRPLAGRIALVAGATRGAGRGIAVELGAAGATVYVTGRSRRGAPSEYGRAETIEDTADLVTAAGGTGIAVPTDHLVPEQVRALVERIDAEQGRLDVLVNDIFGGDPLTAWHAPVWTHSLDDGLHLLHLAVDTHIITAHFALALMVRHPGGLVVEVTDGTDEYNADNYRLTVYYDLAKVAPIRLARSWAHELRDHGGTAVAITPGWLRSETMLDHFGVTEDDWRAACETEPHFAISETPRFVGRAVAALAADPDRRRWNGRSLSSGGLAKEYGFTDLDGSAPDAWRYVVEVQDAGRPADVTGYR